MEWARGFVSSRYATYVDPVSWLDDERFEMLDGSVSRSNDNLQQSASFTTDNYAEGQERWVRLWLIARQGSTIERIPLFTGLAIAPETEINGVIQTQDVQCYSVLKPCQDVLLDRGWYAQKGLDGAKAIEDLLSVTPAPVEIQGDAKELDDNIIAEGNENRLSMVNKILKAMDWVMQIDGSGIIVLKPKPTEPSIVLDPTRNDIMEQTITVTNDWYDCPNVFRAVMDDVSVTAKDEDENSMLSTVNRGREVWAEEDGINLTANDTPADYALRRLGELQKHSITASYTRRFYPTVNVGDIVRSRYRQLPGEYRVTSQKFSLAYGQAVSEEVEKL